MSYDTFDTAGLFVSTPKITTKNGIAIKIRIMMK